MEILLDPLFDNAGWEKKMLNVTCTDAYFVEYTYENFKMMFVKNIRPTTDYNAPSFRNHNIEVSFTYEGTHGAGGRYYVAGNVYRMIQFKDDENSSYYRILKAKSERK